MVKKTVTGTNFAGEPFSVDVRFNLNTTEWSAYVGKHSMESLQKMTDENDVAGMINAIRELIVLSYGTISTDGMRFVKDPVKTNEFLESLVYERLLEMMFFEDADIAEFVEALIPDSLKAKTPKSTKPVITVRH